MNKSKLATLVAASFAGLMLSSPSFATDAQKSQSTYGNSTSAQAAASQGTEADKKAKYDAAIEKCDAKPTDQRSACVQDAEKAQILASRDGGSSSGTRQSRSMERADKNAGEPRESHRTGTSKPSKPNASDERATKRAEDKVVASADAKTDAQAEYRAAIEKCESQPIAQRSACVQDAEKAQTEDMQQSRDGSPERRVPGQQSAK